MSVDADLHNRENEIEKYKAELRKLEEELQTKEFMVGSYVTICCYNISNH